MPCLSPWARLLSHCPRAGGRTMNYSSLEWFLCFMRRVVGEDSSLRFSWLSSTSIASLPHEQAGVRTSINITMLFSFCLAGVEPLPCEWDLNGRMEPSTSLPCGYTYLELSLCRTEVGRIRNACSLLLSDADLGRDKAPLSWSHLTRAELLAC